ncbi:MAG: chitobiase/beta-hexosaminidase C-terminal domain-containing protein, partial [Lachnospiraceae bacterium]|nr:chitobiase/beta-hexosaminidase C-terminal domain-containing protein [Lachnospiraceae bacterium]
MIRKSVTALLLTGCMLITGAFSLLPTGSAAEAFAKEQTEFSRTIRKGNDGVISKTIVASDLEGEEASLKGMSRLKASAYYSDAWETYNSYYYYNQLSDNEKKLYNYFNEQCLSYLANETDIKDKLEDKGKTYYYLPTISTVGLDLTNEQVDRVEYFFHYENPQYFFLDNQKVTTKHNNGSYSSIGLCVYPLFVSGKSRKEARDAIMSTVNSWAPTIEAETTAWGKVRAIHDLIIERVTYNTPLFESDFANDANEYSQSAYSALGWSEKKTVCAGYSQAFALIANKYNIDSVSVTSVTHQWNIVRIGGQWYILDTTWDDADGDNGMSKYYLFFCRSTEKINSIDLEYDGKLQHESESVYKGYLPTCVYDTDSSFEYVGTAPVITEKCPQPVVSVNEATVTITCSDAAATVYYTTDGNNPNPASSKSMKYTAPFRVSGGEDIRAVAVKSGASDSDIYSVS